jgi:GT2 family glycosyltransferase
MIGAILVIHSLYPEKLLASIDNSGEAVHLYLFFHGYDDTLLEKILNLSRERPNTTFLPYGINRGLSRSWNEGIRFSRQCSDEFTLLLNDDLHFVEGGFQEFIRFARSYSGEYGLISVRGLEIGHSQFAGHIFRQDLACCIIGRRAIDEVGYFDTNFYPAYFEDMDYKFRLSLANLPIVAPEATLAEHERSSTARISEKIASSFEENVRRNREYYRKKWGGDVENEAYRHPFNDENRSIRLEFEDNLRLND